VNLSIRPHWAIRVFALWAGVLALLAVARLLLLSRSVELVSNQFGNQGLAWVVFGLNVAFALGFGYCAYSLWQQQNRGRIAFLWLIAVWSIFNVIGLLFGPAIPAAMQISLNIFRYAVGLVIPLFYLNLPRVKARFVESQPGIPDPDRPEPEIRSEKTVEE